jgi:hypothetical protein
LQIFGGVQRVLATRLQPTPPRQLDVTSHKPTAVKVKSSATSLSLPR